MRQLTAEKDVAATFRDARAGFDLFRSRAGQITIEELNAQLTQAGYRAIAPRTMDHYHSLMREGYDRYVSINRFDVARASIPYENSSALARYDYANVDLGVSVMFAKGSRLLEALGRASQVGDVGAVLSFSDSDVMQGLKRLKPQPGNMVTIRFLEAGRTVGGRIVGTDLITDPPNVEVQYSRIVSVADIGVGTALSSQETSFRLVAAEGDLTFELVNRQLFAFFELIEGLRSLINEVGSAASYRFYAEPPVIRRMNMASPLDLDMDLATILTELVPWGAAVVFLKAAGAIPKKRREWYEGSERKNESKLRELEVEEKRLSLEQKQAESDLRSELIQRLTAKWPESDISPGQAAQLIGTYVLPYLQALAENGVVDVRTQDRPQDEGDAT